MPGQNLPQKYTPGMNYKFLNNETSQFFFKFDLFVESRSSQTLSVKTEKSAENEKLTPSLRLDRAYSFELMSLVGVASSD